MCLAAIKFDSRSVALDNISVASDPPTWHSSSMASTEPFNSASFFLSTKPNRSLSVGGRKLWICLIAASASLVAGAGAAVGAWLILPFAGFEIVLVWYAFRVITQHDEDYEMLSVSETEFCWERRCGREVNKLKGSCCWAQLAEYNVGGRQQLELKYAGKSVSVGSQMSDEQRKALARRLQLLFQNV